MNKAKITAVIPAFNEEKTIAEVIRRIRKYADEIILVDDCSEDNTAKIAQAEGAKVLSHNKNQGYDKSLSDGFTLAAERGGEVLFTFDADGQHKAEDIPRVIEPILRGEADVVVGRRPKFVHFTEHLYALIAKKNIGINDPMCGFKAYRINVYQRAGYFDRLSSIGTQLAFQAKLNGYRIAEENITVNERTDASRFGKGLKANWKIFKAVVKITLWLLIIKATKPKRLP